MQRNFHTLLMGMLNGTDAMGKKMAVLKKLNMKVPYNSAISVLGIYPRK